MHKPKMRDSLQSDWPVFWKSVKVMKDKARLFQTEGDTIIGWGSWTHRGHYWVKPRKCEWGW